MAQAAPTRTQKPAPEAAPRRSASPPPRTPRPVTAPGAPAVRLPAETVPLVNGEFAPSPAWVEALDNAKSAGLDVPVRFGKLAEGTIHVHRVVAHHETTYYTNSAQPITLIHPALEPLRQIDVHPVLVISLSKSKVTGYVTQAKQKGDRQQPQHPAVLAESIRKNPGVIGWLGMNVSRFPTPTKNEIQQGSLKLAVDKFGFSLAGFLSGEGSIALDGEQVTFTATAKAKIPGLGEVTVPIERDQAGQLRASVDIPLNYKRFSGSIHAAYKGGLVEFGGTAHYEDEKLNGTASFIVTDAATARNVALEHLGPDAIQAAAEQDVEGKKPPASKGVAVAGWGALQFRFNDWLKGTADVVIDDKGHITVMGKIRPDKEVILIPAPKPFKKNLADIKIQAEYGLPYVGGVGLEADFLLDFNAGVGPARLHKIEAEGRYSTDPMIAKEFSIAASFNLSGYADLALTAKGALVITILRHDIKAGAGVTAKVGVRAYVDARPEIGYRESGPPEQGGKGEFYFKGHAEIAAQPFFGLDGFLFVELSTPWWSPISDHTWTWPIGSLEFALPGEFGIGMDVEHVIGSGKVPDVHFGEVSFDKDKFYEKTLDGELPNKSHDSNQTRPGKWQGGHPENPVPPPEKKQPPPPKVTSAKKKTARGKQTPEQRKASEPAVAAAWKKALTDFHKLAEDSRSHPLGPEIENAVARIASRYHLGDVVADPAGDVWNVHQRANRKDNIKIKRRPQPPALNIDQTFDLEKEHHTVRGHIEGGRVTLLMASLQFKAVKDRVEEIRHHYVHDYLPRIGKKEEASKVETALTRVTSINDSIVSRAERAPAADRERIVREGVTTMARAMDLVNSFVGRVAGAQEKAQAPMAQRPVTFLGHRHKLLVREDVTGFAILMASANPDRIITQITSELSEFFSRYPKILVGKTPAHANLDRLMNDIGKTEINARRHAAATRPGPQRQEIFEDALGEIENKIVEIGEFVALNFGAELGPQAALGAALKDGDAIIRKADEVGFTIDQIGAMERTPTRAGGIIHIGVNAKSQAEPRVFFAYHEYGNKWQVPGQRTPLKKFGVSPQGDPAGIRYTITGRPFINTGDVAQIVPPGYNSQGVFNRRGHLVAQVLGGPGGADNIVALTHTLNEHMRSKYEIRIRDDIYAKDAIYFYGVKPQYGANNPKYDPPVGVTIIEKRKFPVKKPTVTVTIPNV